MADHTNRYDTALKLKSMVTSVGTGGGMEDWQFRLLREELVTDPSVQKLVPAFVRHNVDTEGLWADLKDVHTGNGAYAGPPP